MNVKTEITLTEDHLRYAERMVEEGAYPSISSVVEAGIAKMMLRTRPIRWPAWPTKSGGGWSCRWISGFR